MNYVATRKRVNRLLSVVYHDHGRGNFLTGMSPQKLESKVNSDRVSIKGREYHFFPSDRERCFTDQ
jgi:hypothetical protein